MGEAHLKMVGSMWQAQCGMGREMVRVKAASRQPPQDGRLEVVGSGQHGVGDSMGEAHLETAGSKWWAQCSVGQEMAWVKATSRWPPREGGLEVAGSRQCGAQDGVGEAHLKTVGSRWQAQCGVGQEMVWVKAASRQPP